MGWQRRLLVNILWTARKSRGTHGASARERRAYMVGALAVLSQIAAETQPPAHCRQPDVKLVLGELSHIRAHLDRAWRRMI